jgi:hypothetical protein
MLENSSEDRMNSVSVDHDEMADLLRKIAGSSGSAEEKVARVARKLGWNFRRAKSHWYREARRIELHEIREARAAALRAEEATTNAEIAALRVRLARLESLIATRMPDLAGQAR